MTTDGNSIATLTFEHEAQCRERVPYNDVQKEQRPLMNRTVTTANHAYFAPFARIFVALCLAALLTNAALAQSWIPIPMRSQENADNGITLGGEGGQWPRDIQISPVDPNFMLMGTDVGGVFRSLDGGNRWQIASVGWNSRGAFSIAMDPKNANRALAAAMNTYSYGVKANGIYLTTDKGASWTQVFATDDVSSYGSLTYDQSSYDAALGYCKIAYWVDPSGKIQKTTNGGTSWSVINSSHGNTEMRVKVHPVNGHVYLASSYYLDHGLFRSGDGGVTFATINTDYVWGIDIVDSAPNKVFNSRYSWVHVYEDNTGNDYITGTTGLPGANQPFQNVAVSRANPNRMTTWADLGNFNWVRYYSQDGGVTWAESNMGNGVGGNFRKSINSILPYNVRQGVWAWHPTDQNIVFAWGGDWMNKSIDGGATFQWSNNGYNAIFPTLFNFSPSSPNSVVITTKDYNSFVTTNGGSIWKYAETGFDFGGYSYGGFALNATDMWVADDPTYDASGDPVLKVSHDGGTTWNAVQYNGSNIIASVNGLKYDLVSAGDPNNANVGFCGPYRTADKGVTWARMTGCEMVYTYNPTGSKELYGRNGASIVKSVNSGVSWTTVATYTAAFRDLAYDQVRNRFYLAVNDSLVQYEGGAFTTVSNVPVDQYNTIRVATVAVDPVDPAIVYVGNHRDIWQCNNAVVRSTDAGASWTNLTGNTPLPDFNTPGGPREGWWIRVHPTTREAWTATNCYGMWKIPPPGGVVTVATPTFSPVPGTYTSSQNVTISTTTAGATIRYTTNGNDPTASSTLYSAPISITATKTLKAKAFKTGLTASAITSGLYTITPPAGGGNGLKGEYFNNLSLSGSPALTRTDTTVNFDFGNGSYVTGGPTDTFSARWTGKVKATVSGNYTFSTNSDDGVRLYVNGNLIINNWTDHGPTLNTSAAVNLTAGQQYDIKMEFYENGVGAIAQLFWTPPGGSRVVLPQSQLSSTPVSTLLSQGKPTTASSVETTYASSYATDGDAATRWSSQFSDPQWIQVDLGLTKNITRVLLNWEIAAGKDYKIQVSDNGSSWTDIKTVTGNTASGVLDYTGLTGSGRYVRVYGTSRTTIYGYSLWEFQVYGY